MFSQLSHWHHEVPHSPIRPLTPDLCNSCISRRAYGRVVNTVDGDTFDVQLQDYDSRITEDQIRIRLADIDCPEIHGPDACEAGKRAAAYTRSWLLNNYVFLDLDDKTGKDPYGRWVAVCYLSDSGKPGRNYNKDAVGCWPCYRQGFREQRV